MRNVDFQTVHTQTPAVERAFQNRHAEVDNDQRQAANIQKEDADQKTQETQKTPEAEGGTVNKDKDKEKRRGKKKKQEQKVAVSKKQEARSGSSGRIDILV